MMPTDGSKLSFASLRTAPGQAIFRVDRRAEVGADAVTATAVTAAITPITTLRTRPFWPTRSASPAQRG